MKILDELHSSHYQCFEEKFQKAKSQNQKMLSNVESLLAETQGMLDENNSKQ